MTYKKGFLSDKAPKIGGLGVAMVTPFTEDGAMDAEGTEQLVEHLVEGKVDFLVVLGSTGEAATMSPHEQSQFTQLVLQLNKGRLPVVLGRSSNNTAAIVEDLKSLDYTGIDYILSAVPHYSKPSQEGIRQHFLAVAQASQRPVILYNIPGRTGVNMTAQTTLTLAQHPNIVGIKEASGDLNQVLDILAGCPDDFAVLSGDDSLTLPMLSIGAHGVISVTGNVRPKEFGAVVHNALDGNTAEAARANAHLAPLYKALFAEGNPTGVKCALGLLNICEDYVRLPLQQMSNEGQFHMQSVLRGRA